MSLRKTQTEFAKLLPSLINKAFALGYEVTLGDAYRDPRVHGELGLKKSYSHPNSAHKVRLAIDLNLFTPTGQFIEGLDGHRQLGEWWEQQHALARWGGRFRDPNHYSFEWKGVR